MRNLEKFKEYIPRMGEPNVKSVALLIDGPNMLRKEFNFDLDVVQEILEDYGKIKVGKVFLNQYASDKLIEADRKSVV